MAVELVKYLIIAIIVIFVLDCLGKTIFCIKEIVKSKCHEQKIKNNAKKYLKEKKEKEDLCEIKKYYGLFEFFIHNCNDEQNIKQQYCSIIKKQINSKYKNSRLKINATDKIFFYCSDFSIFNNLINDFVELYKNLANINAKKFHKTELKFSIWGESVDNIQKAYCALCEMNNLNFINQVIVNDRIYIKYQKEQLKGFSFSPYGTIQSVEDNKTYDLYRLLKVLVPESDNE